MNDPTLPAPAPTHRRQLPRIFKPADLPDFHAGADMRSLRLPKAKGEAMVTDHRLLSVGAEVDSLAEASDVVLACRLVKRKRI